MSFGWRFDASCDTSRSSIESVLGLSEVSKHVPRIVTRMRWTVACADFARDKAAALACVLLRAVAVATRLIEV